MFKFVLLYDWEIVYVIIKWFKTRRSERQHPQPLNQWTYSPFMSQQVGNCKSFTLTHYLADLFVIPWLKINPIVHPTSYPTHIPFIPSESTHPFLIYSNFNILRWKSNVKVMVGVKVESHEVGETFYWLTSLPFRFMSIDPSIPEVRNFLNLTLKIQGESEKTMMLHKWRSRKSHITSNGTSPSSGFRDMASTKSGPSAALFDKFCATGSPYGTNGQITMTVHNYKSRQVHKTLNGLNPSSDFRDLPSAKSGPNLCQIWQIFGPWASAYEANGQMIITVHSYRHRKFHRTSNGESSSSGYRDFGSGSRAAARPVARPDRDHTIPLQPGELRDKKKRTVFVAHVDSMSY